MKGLKYIKIGKLVEKAKLGDSQAFSELYDLTYKKIFFLVFNILRDIDLTEDAVQEIFIIALKSINNLENPKLFLAWINKISYNYCVKELSKLNKFKDINSEYISNDLSSNYQDKDPLDSLIIDEHKRELIQLINRLSPIHSNILLMRYFEDMKISEIAYALNLPEGTVKSRLSNAKKSLKLLYNNNKEKSFKKFVFLLYPMFKIPLYKLESNRYNLYYNIKYNNIYNGFSAILAYTAIPIVLPTSIICLINNSSIGYNSFNEINNFIALEDTDYKKDQTYIRQSDISVANNILTIEKNNILDIFMSDISKYTNQDIVLDIKLNNKSNIQYIYIKNSIGEYIDGNYIKDDLYRVYIDKNGYYNLSIILDSGEIISKDLNICCIDKSSPSIVNHLFSNNELEVKLNDNLSNVNFDNISLFNSKGEKLQIKNKDAYNDTVIFEVNDDVVYLKVSDFAKNTAIYTINYN